VFFSNISHEFRTPLALMLGPLEDALNDASGAALPASQRERLDLVHRNSLRLLKLVNSLLDFSRMEAGRMRARFAPTDLAALTRDLASGFRSATDRAGLTLTIDCPPLPEAVHVDRDMWEKIVLNLVSNAFKFTFEGEIAVELRASSDGSAAMMRVRDTGTGIPRTELPRLFERFHRIEGARSRTFEGSGIGLALVSELIRQHGGTISVASDVGRGSTFTVAVPFGRAHLPADRVAAEAKPAAPGARADVYVQEALRWLPDAGDLPEPAFASAVDDLGADSADDAARGQGERVLLADDNADMREYIRRLLDAQGYGVEAVADGEAALAAARRMRPALILTDVMMPRLDGLELLAAVRDDQALCDVPVILLSARAGEEARVEGLDAGADDYVGKPFSARELLARVRVNIELARMRREAEAAQREQAARLEAVLATVPTAVWFTHERDASHVFGNAHGLALMRLPSGANASLSAPGDALPSYRPFRNGRLVPLAELPLRRALRGDVVSDEEMELRFDDGAAATLLFHAAPIRDAAGAIQGAVCAAIDITERKQQQRHRELLLHELNHRVKNTLATVQSLAVQTLRNADSLGEARAVFEARLIALSKAHDVLTNESWESAAVGDVVARALAAYAGPDPGQGAETRVRYGGPDIRLQPKAVLALSMALHELATNAVKYGALSQPGGHVDVSWSVDGTPPIFVFVWKERGGPPVSRPARRGFGSRLVEYGLAQDLGGTAELAFEPDGVRCTFTAPLDELRPDRAIMDAGAIAASSHVSIGSGVTHAD